MTNKSPGILDWILLIIKRDLLISSKRSASYITPVAFFLIIVSLFPLAFGPEQKQLSSMASNIIWIAALLSSLLAIEGIFNDDFNDGTLEQIIMSGEPLFLLVIAKVFCHWLIAGAPIVVSSLLAGIFLYFSFENILVLIFSLTLGSLLFSLLGAFGGALSLGKSPVLSTIIVLPFSIPVLILGTSCVNASINQQDYIVYLLYLGSLVAIGLPGLSVAIATSIKINYE